MEIVFTEQFEQAYEKLAEFDRRNVRKALTLSRDDTRYPGLHVKKFKGSGEIWEARPSKRLRMTFKMTEETVTMRNVGEHDKVLKRP